MNWFGFEDITDYAWLKKGRKYWTIWAGNPFCIEEIKVPIIGFDKEEIILEIKRMQMVEKERFENQFPDIKWVQLK